jgi:hypothetical protein
MKSSEIILREFQKAVNRLKDCRMNSKSIENFKLLNSGHPSSRTHFKLTRTCLRLLEIGVLLIQRYGESEAAKYDGKNSIDYAG